MANGLNTFNLHGNMSSYVSLWAFPYSAGNNPTDAWKFPLTSMEIGHSTKWTLKDHGFKGEAGEALAGGNLGSAVSAGAIGYGTGIVKSAVDFFASNDTYMARLQAEGKGQGNQAFQKSYFEGTEPRKFSLEFSFIPKSSADSEKLAKSIHKFKEHIYPSLYRDAGIPRLVWPSRFLLRWDGVDNVPRLGNADSPIWVCNNFKESYILVNDGMPIGFKDTAGGNIGPVKFNLSFDLSEMTPPTLKTIQTENPF